MFMDRNRKTNGAADPGSTAKSDAAEQRAQRVLSTNQPIPKLDDLRFPASEMDCAAINRARYMGGLSASNPLYNPDKYGSKIPYVGNKNKDEI